MFRHGNCGLTPISRDSGPEEPTLPWGESDAIQSSLGISRDSIGARWITQVIGATDGWRMDSREKLTLRIIVGSLKKVLISPDADTSS
jgi:hypothetical protein